MSDLRGFTALSTELSPDTLITILNMKAVNEWNAANNYPALEMGIGINSGSAVVGNIGSSHRMKYGCIGETVNLARRVESFTIGG